MPVINSIANDAAEAAAWRRDFHRHPELLFDVQRTAGIVAEKLKQFGCDQVETGVGRTGVVAVINGRGPGRGIGLRADMDALPITEATGLPHTSTKTGLMHACGHDGHTAMLLAAARHLAGSRNFNGRAVLIFQPAEEGGTGAAEMLETGFIERFGVDEVYALHNLPGLPVGQFAIRPGTMLAASDAIDITITGKGGHAAAPHLAIDVVLIAAEIITGLQSVVSRSINPTDAAVISIPFVRAGDAFNVLPETAQLHGTMRALAPALLDRLETRVRKIVEQTAEMHGGHAEVAFLRDSPATINCEAGFAHALNVARMVAGSGNVDAVCEPLMVSEDFAYMLDKRPGAFIFLGNGDSAPLHHPAYEFNDAAIPFGASWFAGLVEQRGSA